jgi:cob(I)alamin adenosyltransferase
MKSQIYTKVGDAGTTSLVGGTKVTKDDLQIESYGNVDELNSQIGFMRSLMPKDHCEQVLLLKIQNELFVLGSLLATEIDKRVTYKLPTLSPSLLLEIESSIDKMDGSLSKLKNFIIPAGSQASCAAHVVRTVCRRVERGIVRLGHKEVDLIPSGSVQLINRLSDYFFVLARELNALEKIGDIIWVP